MDRWIYKCLIEKSVQTLRKRQKTIKEQSKVLTMVTLYVAHTHM